MQFRGAKEKRARTLIRIQKRWRLKPSAGSNKYQECDNDVRKMQKNRAGNLTRIQPSTEHNNFSRDFKTVNFLPRNQRRVFSTLLTLVFRARSTVLFLRQEKQIGVSCRIICVARKPASTIGYHFTPII